jgi:tetratricopeptide (TPR) repeat protein
VEADGSYAPARFHLAGVFSALQRWRDARDAFDGFLHTNRDPKLAAIAVSERDHAVREQRGEADAGSEDALQREMLEAEAGRALRENQLHAVVVAAGRALAIDRGAWKPYLFTAAALVRAGRPDLALPCLSAAVERAPASEGPPIRALIRNVNKLIDMNNALIALRRSVAENDPRGTAAALRAASKAMPTDVGLRLAAERTLESVSAAPPLEDNE